ncbi:class I SAM-dependent methyltransferase [Streptomyces sp. NPDC005963]|uniref:class I SAM-dependent methyltransferase n=1 Tax=Streptomyces sp. NPDC005963 TaxID=3156721 RepID=UPI0033DBE97F
MEIDPAVRSALTAFTSEEGPRAGDAFRRLVTTVWNHGTAEPTAAASVPDLVAALGTATARHRPLLAILLGLLAETGGDEGGTRAAVHGGLDRYLALVDDARTDQPLAAALLYLLGHFPQDRDTILGAVRELPVAESDLSRLDRRLSPLDPLDPQLGRTWPSPVDWELSEEERALDLAWVRELPGDQVAALWENDSRSLLAYAGAKALWAAEHGWSAYQPDPSLTLPPAGRAEQRANPVSAHADALRCPACRGRLEFRVDGAHCTGTCGADGPLVEGVLDLSGGVGNGTAAMARNVPLRYDNALRPAFLRLMGTNWAGVVPVPDEDRYLEDRVRPVDGPVLDLAAGTGRWTWVLAEQLGAERVIALDLSPAMLKRLREVLPEVSTVRGSAVSLPFDDSSLGAVNCWNALQALPDAGEAIAEVGRCLRPGGTFTLMTFRPAEDPLYRYFQTLPRGVIVFEPEAVRELLEKAGMTVVDLSGEGSFLFITAVREPR